MTAMNLSIFIARRGTDEYQRFPFSRRKTGPSSRKMKETLLWILTKINQSDVPIDSRRSLHFGASFADEKPCDQLSGRQTNQCLCEVL
jgi:hypothetical protein